MFLTGGRKVHKYIVKSKQMLDPTKTKTGNTNKSTRSIRSVSIGTVHFGTLSSLQTRNWKCNPMTSQRKYNTIQWNPMALQRQSKAGNQEHRFCQEDARRNPKGSLCVPEINALKETAESNPKGSHPMSCQCNPKTNAHQCRIINEQKDHS